MTVAVDLRCPNNYSRLFAKFLVPNVPLTIVEGNLVEFSCRECKRDQQPNFYARLTAVLHRYDIAGGFVETEVVFEDGTGMIAGPGGQLTIRADPPSVQPDQEE